MKALRLILNIQANFVELIENSGSHYNVIKSVDIRKENLEGALSEIYEYVIRSNLGRNIDFIIPSEEIKIFRIPLVNKIDEQNINLIAENFFKNEKNVNFVKLFYNISELDNSIEIGVVDRNRLFEGITFIENIGFKILNAVGNINDQKMSFVFDVKSEFKRQSKFKDISTSFFFLAREIFASLIPPKILSLNFLGKSQNIRNFAIFGLALLATITLATAYFDRSAINKGSVQSDVNSKRIASNQKKYDNLKEEFLNSDNIFFLTQKINLLPNKDNSGIKKITLSNTDLVRNLPVYLVENSLLDKSKNEKLADLIYPRNSEIFIEYPDFKLATLDDVTLTSKSLHQTWVSSKNQFKNANDPFVNLKNNVGLISGEKIPYSEPKLNLKAPLISNRFYPKIRPNEYPFDVKNIPKEYAQPRLRPSVITQLAANNDIFSDYQLNQSIIPKIRPQFRKRIVASNYSKEIAKLATTKNAINKQKLNVLSIYSRGSQKRAIVIFPTGQTKLVKVGDTLDGGKVAAIGTNEIRYVKGGNNLVLRIPQG